MTELSKQVQYKERLTNGTISDPVETVHALKTKLAPVTRVDFTEAPVDEDSVQRDGDGITREVLLEMDEGASALSWQEFLR